MTQPSKLEQLAEKLEWHDMATARTRKQVLLLLGETVPDHANARAASFIEGGEAEELGYREYAKYGAWLIWNDCGDFYCVDECAPLGWLPLPDTMPVKHRTIDGTPPAKLEDRNDG